MRAVTLLDGWSMAAIVGVVVGWFVMNTLIVSLGSLQHGVRFYEMSAVIADPTRLFFGVDSTLQPLMFGLLCLVCLAAPLAPHVPVKSAWLVHLGPLALILLCGLLFYSRTSSEFIKHGGLAARHVSVAAGGYLAVIGSIVLALRGVRRVRHAPR